MSDSISRAVAIACAALLVSTPQALGAPVHPAFALSAEARQGEPQDPPTGEDPSAAEDGGAAPEPASESTPELAPAAAGGDAASGSAALVPATDEQVKQFEQAIHSLLIGQADVAAGAIDALFASGVSDEQLALIVDERGSRDRLDRAFSRGRNLEGASALAAQLEARILAGLRQSSRNALRIDEAVKELGGTMRQQMLARARLLNAGEYAVPALVRALADDTDARVSSAARATLVDLKRMAVAPLCAALEGSAASVQRRICDVLSEIGYPSAAPFLLDLGSRAGTPADVRDAAMRACARLGSSTESAAAEYAGLARRYFDQTLALIPYPADPSNPVWQWSDAYGLVGTEVPTPLYCETMAVECAVRALRLDANSKDALATFVAADLRRATLMAHLNLSPEAPSAEEESSAAASLLTGRYSAEFFATAAGAEAGQAALALALDANDPLLARAVIAVLAKTASAPALVAGGSDRSPVVECLAFADRRVRFDAAIALANALPQTGFANDSFVVPTLASMVKSGGTIGAVIASTEEDRQALGARIASHGLSTVVSGVSFSEVEGKLDLGQVIDLVVVQGSRAGIDETVRALRISRAAATAPVVIVSAGSDASVLSADYERDARVSVFLASAPDEAFGKAVESAVGAASGLAISEEQSSEYTTAALSALLLVAQSASPVFDIRDAESTLAAALVSGESAQRLTVAQVLALVPTESAQRALMDAALAASGEEKGALFLATATSARRIGNQLLPRQIDALQALIRGAGASDVDAAGALHGALSLSPSDVVRLITGASN